jgi:hypothetical protein
MAFWLIERDYAGQVYDLHHLDAANEWDAWNALAARPIGHYDLCLDDEHLATIIDGRVEPHRRILGDASQGSNALLY